MPFTLGVASGEPAPDGFVIWTRLAPKPFEEHGGMSGAPADVDWVVASDEKMSHVAQKGTVQATDDWAYSVHVELQGLEPDRWYWYQFRAGGEVSTVGRARTAPAAGAAVDRLRFAFASCQQWQKGFYTAYRDMLDKDLDLVVFLGDYIYESGINQAVPRPIEVPFRATFEANDLESYRWRYALYKLDPNLQAAHAMAPWIVTWDDHEVKNNYFGGGLNRGDYLAKSLLERRAAAYRAYYEHQPLRKEAIPQGPDLKLYRRRSYGSLLAFQVLDTRQYRSMQGALCFADERAEDKGYCPPSLDPSRTMLGQAQKQWLFDGMNASTARWQVLAQQVLMARMDTDPAPDVQSFGGSEMDKWDGYAVERDEVVAHLASAAKARSFNPVVISGDIHRNYVFDLKTNWDDPSQKAAIGTEFVGTSLTSEGDEPLDKDGQFTTVCGDFNGNPHNHLYDNHRGYVLCTVDQETWHADYRVLPTVKDPNAHASTLISFAVEWAEPGAQVDGACSAPGAEPYGSGHVG